MFERTHDRRKALPLENHPLLNSNMHNRCITPGGATGSLLGEAAVCKPVLAWCANGCCTDYIFLGIRCRHSMTESGLVEYSRRF